MFKYRNLLWAGVAILIAASTGLAQGTDSLANTEWSRQFPKGSIAFRFQDGGKVLGNVAGNQDSGTFVQEGGNVTMAFSDSTFQGQIMGQTMSLTLVNMGKEYSFQIDRKGSPANPAPVKNAPAVSPANPGPSEVTLQKVKVDDLTFHCQAGSILAPQGWKTNGGLTCDWSAGVPQVKTEFNVLDPHSLKQVEVFYVRPFTWNKNGGTGIPGVCFMPNQQGTIQGGFEVQPMELDPQTFVKKYVLPRFRQGMQLRIVAVKQMPFGGKGMSDGDKAIYQAMGGRSSSGRVRVEYMLQGQAVEEDFYVELSECTSMAVTFGWSNCYAVRSAKGQLDADTNLLVAVAGSFQFDPAYKADLDQARQIGQQTQLNTQNAVMERSQIVRNAQNYCANLQNSTYQNQQKVQNHTNQQFSNYIRGVEQYGAPGESSPVSLPSGYNQVWGNGLGQYVLSNDPNVHQRLNGTNWQQLQVTR